MKSNDETADSSGDEEIITKKQVSKKRVAIDSDDDSSADEGQPSKALEDDKDQPSSPRRGTAPAADSDSDLEQEDHPKSAKKIRKRAVMEDSSDDEEIESSQATKKSTDLSQSLLKNKDVFDAEGSSSEEDEEAGKNVKKSRRSSRSSSRSSRSSSRDSIAENEDDLVIKYDDTEEQDKKSGNTKAGGQKRQDRKTKAAAMAEIYSESQRMFRESGVKLNYHRPRQVSLDEFLNRRKKQVINEVIGDNIKIRHITKDPTEAERALEEAEKYTEEFYKNDESDQEDPDDKDDADFNPEVAKEKENISEEQASNDLIENDSQKKAEQPEPELAETEAVATVPEPHDADEEATTTIVNAGSQNQDVDDSGIVANSNSKPVTSDESAGNSDQEEEASAKSDKPREEDKNCAGPEEQSESLNLFLEPDSERLTEESDDSGVIQSSQKADVDLTLSEKTKQNTVLTKKLAMLVNRDVDMSSLLSKKPKLASFKSNHGGDEIILDDGEEARKDKGLDKLMTRFARHAAANSNLPSKAGLKKNVEVTVVRLEKDAETGKETLAKDTIDYKVDLSEVAKAKKSEKPGAQLVALKTTLKQQIIEKRRAERAKRLEQQKIDNEEAGLDDGGEGVVDADDDLPEDEVEEDEFENEEDTDESSEAESEPPEEDDDAYIRTEKKSRIKSAFVDDEADESNDVRGDDEIEDEDEAALKLTLDDDDDDEEEAPGTPGFDNMSDSEQPRWTPVDERSQEGVAFKEQKIDEKNNGARKKLGFESLFDTSDPQVTDLDDVVGLCSGQFLTQAAPRPEAQSQAELDSQMMQDTPDTLIMSQLAGADSQTQTQSLTMVPTQDQLCSEDLITPETNAGKKESTEGDHDVSQAKLKSLLESDDDEVKEDDNDKDSEKKRKSKKNKKKRLVLSDDSDSDEEDNGNTNDEVLDDDGPLEVMYDSEENEIEAPVQFKGFRNKKGGMRKEFLENEAELSGSDLGSEDEDERGLDRLELEAGDLDDIDEDEVRDEVGKLHHRQILDEDKRDIRLFQEAFLEDGELHSDNARQRKFKWKGLNEDSFVLEARKTQDGDEAAEDELNELDEKRRLERLEREKWLLENEEKNKKKISGEDELEVDPNDSQFFNLASKAMRRLESKSSSTSSLGTIEAAKTTIATKVFKSPNSKLPLQSVSGNQKGSFLSRGQTMLQRLAEMTKGKGEAKSGSTAKHSNNFVFTVKSPPKDASTEASANEGAEDNKRQTRNSKKHKSFHGKSGGPSAKRAKIDRTLDENSSDTIFGLLQ